MLKPDTRTPDERLATIAGGSRTIDRSHTSDVPDSPGLRCRVLVGGLVAAGLGDLGGGVAQAHRDVGGLQLGAVPALGRPR